MDRTMKVMKVVGELRSGAGGSTVSFANDRIGDDGVMLFVNELKHAFPIMVLNLSSNLIGPKGAGALAEWISTSTTLTNLDLSDNLIGDDGAAAIASAIQKNKTLEGLSLENNEIGDYGASMLAEALRSDEKIAYLYLGGDKRGNTFGDDGMIPLALSLAGNMTLSWLGIRNNVKITNKSVPALRYLLRNSMIRSFDCDGTSIGKAARKELVALSCIIEERRTIRPKMMSSSIEEFDLTTSQEFHDDPKVELASDAESLDSSWSVMEGPKPMVSVPRAAGSREGSKESEKDTELKKNDGAKAESAGASTGASTPDQQDRCSFM